MGIKGKLKEELTMDSILSKVSSYDIYKFFNPEKDWELNKISHSPFSKDNNPSFLIGNKYGEMSHIAFNDTSKRGDCFSFVKQLYGLYDLNSVLEYIDSEMGLGIKGVKKEYEKVVSQYKQLEITKRNTLIQVITKKFSKEELDYWSKFTITEEELKENNIYSIKKAYLNRKLLSIGDHELRFGYYYPSGSYWKLYFPNRDKKKKWLTNAPLNTIYGLDNIQKDKNTLICKSLKDFIICKKIHPNCVQVQNESISSFSQEAVDYIKNNSKIVYYGGDSDNPGKQASYSITLKFGFKHINPPDYLLPSIKDWADWVKSTNLETLKEYFKMKELI